MARVFKKSTLALRHRNLDCPGPCPRIRIFNSKLINECVGIRPAETFDELHVFAASPERILIRKIRGFDNERVSFPMPARVAFPQTDIRWKMRTAIRRNDASFMTHFNQQCDIPHALRNLHIIVVSRWSDRGASALKDQTTFGQGPVLGSVEFMASDRGLAFLLPFSRCGHHLWNLSVLWIDD